MKILKLIILYVMFFCGCSNQNTKEPSNADSLGNLDTINGLNIFIKAKDIIQLPSLDGIEVLLENNTDKPIHIWENIPPSGKMELYFTIQANKNESFRIEPIILNWDRSFSKVVKLTSGEKYRLKTNITHWEINNDKLDGREFSVTGSIKAHYKPEKALGNTKLWEGEISSNELNVVVIKHFNKKRVN